VVAAPTNMSAVSHLSRQQAERPESNYSD